MVRNNWHFSRSNKGKHTTLGEGCPVSVASGGLVLCLQYIVDILENGAYYLKE